MDQNSVQQLILSLLSGALGSIIGALVGGYLSYKGAIDAAKQQIEHLYKQEQSKRDYDEKKEETVMLQALITEANENLELATKWQTSHSKSILSTEVWSIYKGKIPNISETVVPDLIKSYTEIKRYNALADYDKVKVAVGHGMLDQALQQQAGVVVETLAPLIDKLIKIQQG